ncbi:MAG: regulatory protein RecX [Candidatus Velamenicoccus archaeovorus]
MTGPRRSRVPKEPLSCHERALGLLAVRSRSRRELQTRLLRAGFDPDEVGDELERLTAVGLLDDARFAQELAGHAVGVKLAGRRAVASALAAKGVDRATIDAALEGLEGDERDRALRLARTRAARMATLPPETAYRRLVALLGRRGYDGATARWAAGAALRVEAGPVE